MSIKPKQISAKKSTLADICDVAYAVHLIGGKWKISIIWELARHPSSRLSALRRKLIGISEGVLITQLKILEQDGLIKRIDYKKVPPHVEYLLTEQGNLLVRTITVLEQWGHNHRNLTHR